MEEGPRQPQVRHSCWRPLANPMTLPGKVVSGLPFSPNPSSIQSAAARPAPTPNPGSAPTAPSPAQSAHRPCTRRPRTGSYVCATACTGRRARSRPRRGRGKCAAAPPRSRSGTARTCAHRAVSRVQSRSFPARPRLAPPSSPRPHPAQGAQAQEPGPSLWEGDSQPGHSGSGTDGEEEASQGLLGEKVEERVSARGKRSQYGVKT